MNLLAYIQAKHNLIFKLVFVFFCSLLLAHMLPDRPVKGHRVDSFTAIWPFEDLVVEQDFLIGKSPWELRVERDKIRREAPLFFEERTEEREQKLAELDKLKFDQPILYN